MASAEERYQALKALDRSQRWQWLQEHSPTEFRGHWWLGLIERAELDASPTIEGSTNISRAGAEFLVHLIEMAIRDGMPPHYAASRLALLTSAVLKAGGNFDFLPQEILPDHLAQRILRTFRLDREEALAVASRTRAAADLDDINDADSDALREICWVLPDLEMLAPHVRDPGVEQQVRKWLDISPTLLS
ncbi:hypothetical protein WEI85_45325 [Actinomycetes bacterium KLBMP 9797]